MEQKEQKSVCCGAVKEVIGVFKKQGVFKDDIVSSFICSNCGKPFEPTVKQEIEAKEEDTIMECGEINCGGTCKPISPIEPKIDCQQDCQVNKEEKWEERIWIFIAYTKDEYGSVPIFSKLFNDHTKMKEFSAKHSSIYKKITKGYNSDYLDLTEKSFITQTRQEAIAEERERIVEKIKNIKINWQTDGVL